VKSQQNGNAVKIDLKVVDRTSTVASVDYAVDSNKDWQLVLPTNQIYDSPEETVSFSVKDLSPGQHQVTLRATDSKGNQAFENLFVTVQAPAAAK
jgi:flagellar hook assembly protein FlgD